MNETQKKLTVELTGLIELVAKSLYSDELVCIRELIANAMDALTVMQTDLSTKPPAARPAWNPRCDIFTQEQNLVVVDNGIGMQAEEMDKFLTVVGRSGKTDWRRDFQSHEMVRQMIGQFGIGIMSAFVIGERIVVRSRRHESKEGCEFACDKSGNYTIKPVAGVAAGTSVTVRIKDGAVMRRLNDSLEDKVRSYGLLLPYEITRQGGVRPYNLRRTDVPWRLQDPTKEDLAKFLVEGCGFGAPAFTFMVRKPTVNAVFFVPAEKAFLNLHLAADLYTRGVLVRKKAAGLLPEGALFIDGVVECNDLTPTASREEVQKDENFDRCVSEIHEGIVEELAKLGGDLKHLQNVIGPHGNELKAFMLHDKHPVPSAAATKKLFDCIAPSLHYPVAGQAGVVTLGSYVDAAELRADASERKNIYYSGSTSGVSFQIHNVMRDKGLETLVVNEPGDGKHDIDYRVLERFASERQFELRRAEEREDLFEAPKEGHWNLVKSLFEDAAIAAIQPPRMSDHDSDRRLTVKVAGFEPNSIPILMLVPRRDRLSHDLDTFRVAPGDDLTPEARRTLTRLFGLAKQQMDQEAGRCVAFVNTNHWLIKKIAETPDIMGHPALPMIARDILHLAYVYTGFTFTEYALGMLRDTHLRVLELLLASTQQAGHATTEALVRKIHAEFQ